MSFCAYDSDIVICNNDHFIMYNINDNLINNIELPHVECDKIGNIHNNVDIESYHMIISTTFSNDGKYLLICTNRKQLCLYDRKSKELISNRILPRAASKVIFSPNNDIIVADKAGDAYLFSTTNPVENGTLLLGHLSMLLDILVTEDGKYILTTDRDEKIRVSMFPHSYNIVSYCLGHSKFVTNICELPHKKDILISSGGDGTLKFWDYVCGNELLTVNFSEKIPKYNIDNFNEILKTNHEEHVSVLPVKHLKATKLNKLSSLVVISFYSSNVLLVYIVDETVDSHLTATWSENIIMEDEPLDCFLKNNQLWILTNLEVIVYILDNNHFVLDSTTNNTLKELNKAWMSLNNNTNRKNLFPSLYKRKYDNVQQYLERKKLRLPSTLE
ncbi:PREDICTED: tRNA (guanine-N(7)-)-methyltransferase non-catalytic subunit wdr4 [Polistes dominula]|uniref:tRNA (Guanine-N(7)-)-methyltransferase non-catalytic subunit wdr4 n=1 Tax=Polistes dominula TaxID=743375 RepID=A0ABM1IYR3_POLDO|nr:PREDICTED: tRNA (guanine-N(7)-)-methyltransferase non-catalytic subunit wdr4 [Polistes dominula]